MVLIGEGDVVEADGAAYGGREVISGGGVGFVLGVEDFEDAVGGGATGEDHLVEGVEAVDGFVEEAEEEEEGGEFAGGHFAFHDGGAAEGEDEGVSVHAEEGHAGGVDGPPFHHAEVGAAEEVGEAVEAVVFGFFGGVGFDLADAGDVVVEEGVEVGGGFALVFVAIAAAGGVDPRADAEEGYGEGGPGGDFGVEVEEDDADAEDLECGDESLFDAVDEDALHVHDILDDAGHDVAGTAGIEPAEG